MLQKHSGTQACDTTTDDGDMVPWWRYGPMSAIPDNGPVGPEVLEHPFPRDIVISGCRRKEWGQLRGLISTMIGFISAMGGLIDAIHRLRKGLQKGQVIDFELCLLGLELFKLFVDKVLGNFGAYT